jgi:glycerol-3-phosphate O-acyltransferase
MDTGCAEMEAARVGVRMGSGAAVNGVVRSCLNLSTSRSKDSLHSQLRCAGKVEASVQYLCDSPVASHSQREDRASSSWSHTGTALWL